MTHVSERFLKYVSFDTESNPESNTIPTSAKQKELAKYLVDEMKTIGIKDAYMDEFGYVYGTIEKNTSKQVPTIGFISHMDTSPDLSGKNIKYRIVKNYDGKNIVLNQEKNIIMKTSEFESLEKYVGQDLIVTDGTTLLGADDKAGIAEILTMAETFYNNPSIEHGEIKIGFTPDEEVGSGADHFNVKNFGADFAYTIDGGELGEVEYENFNAASANIIIKGTNIHPGSAKRKMVNSMLISIEFNNMLPVFENPAFTEGYEGFNHLCDINGTVEETKMQYIIRDHNMDSFTAKKERFSKITNYLNEKYGDGTVEAVIKDSYFNMKEKILPHMHIIETAKKAMEALDIVPIDVPIRGGTDGARLSFMGLPCPNLCTGGQNFHGRYEYVSIQSMEKIVDILLKINELYLG
ncbi:peptidase T [Sedimentibacter sp. zth1]|uniref:peptidase T n=1 Tax=Sedimentibacter sp. zth1 TaxID=2816908 RepID=UPI001A925A79|nr:peptidase T [Sedimentibacter sp. zth1]QSX05061.1 peptidase T [Sedimentibacter sp. zth1]